MMADNNIYNIYDFIPIFKNRNCTDYMILGYSFKYSEKGCVILGYTTVDDSYMDYDRYED